MIHNIRWRQQVRQDIEQRLAVVHTDLTTIAAALRDSVGVDVWTETPSDRDNTDPTKRVYSLEGWRAHFKGERARLASFATNHGTALQAYDAALATALTGYLSSTATLGQAFNQLANAPAYRDASGNLVQRTLTQAHRDALATAIEAELE